MMHSTGSRPAMLVHLLSLLQLIDIQCGSSPASAKPEAAAQRAA